MKKTSVIIIFLVIILLFSSCNMKQSFNNPYAEKLPDKASPEDEKLPCKFYADVYSLTGDSYTKSNVLIETFNDTQPPVALINAVLSQKTVAEIADTLTADDVIVTYDICIVNLSGTYSGKVTDWLKLESVVFMTLNGFCGCRTLCMLHNAKMRTYNGLPLGAAREIYSTPDEYAANRLEKLKSATADSPATIDFLYFAHIENSLLLNPRTVTESIIKKSDTTPDRIDALLKSYAAAYTRYYNRINKTTLSECFTLSLATTGAEQFGLYTIEIEMNRKANLDVNSLMGAVALTVLCNIDKVGMLDIVYDGETYSHYFSDYLMLIGTSFDVYYPLRNESTLEKKQIIVPAVSCYSPDVILQWMTDSSNLSNTLLPKALGSGLEFVQISDNMAVICVTESLHNSIKQYVNDGVVHDSPETRERLLLYAIVNTLTILPTVNSVLFIEKESGSCCEPLYNIYLGRPIFENPGLNAD